MKYIRIILISLATLAFLSIALTHFLPSKFEVIESIAIKAPVNIVWQELSDINTWQDWTGLANGRDQEFPIEVYAVDSAVGSFMTWTEISGKQGKVLIHSRELKERIVFTFTTDDGEYRAKGIFELHSENESAVLRWSLSGKIPKNPVERYMGLQIPKRLSAKLNKGLQSMKQRCEMR